MQTGYNFSHCFNNARILTVTFIASSPSWISANLSMNEQRREAVIYSIDTLCDLNNRSLECSLVLTAMHGAKAYCIPVALTSRAVASPIFLMRTGSLFNSRILVRNIHVLKKRKSSLYSSYDQNNISTVAFFINLTFQRKLPLQSISYCTINLISIEHVKHN